MGSSSDGLSKKESGKQAADDAKVEWLKFPDLVGTRLSCRSVKGGSWELVTASGVLWASWRGRQRVIRVRGRDYTWQHEQVKGIRNHLKYDPLKRPPDSELVDAATRTTVLRVSGTHFSRKAGTRITLPDQTSIELPVTGTRPLNATMAAVDGSGNTLIRYRLDWPVHRWTLFPTARGSAGISLRNPLTVTEVLVTTAR